jgi:hypothetical protein
MYQTIPLFKLFFSHLPIGSKKFQFGLALLCVLLVILCNFSAPFMLWRPLKYVRGVGGGGHGPGRPLPVRHCIMRGIVYGNYRVEIYVLFITPNQ